MARRHSREPIRETCPAIDEVQRRLKLAFEAVEEAFAKLESLDRELEDLRAANGTLRDWAREEAERVDELEGELSEMESERDKLLAQVQELQTTA